MVRHGASPVPTIPARPMIRVTRPMSWRRFVPNACLSMDISGIVIAPVKTHGYSLPCPPSIISGEQTVLFGWKMKGTVWFPVRYMSWSWTEVHSRHRIHTFRPPLVSRSRPGLCIGQGLSATGAWPYLTPHTDEGSCGLRPRRMLAVGGRPGVYIASAQAGRQTAVHLPSLTVPRLRNLSLILRKNIGERPPEAPRPRPPIFGRRSLVALPRPHRGGRSRHRRLSYTP